MNFLKQCYLELDKLEYSEENVAELFSILNRVIKFLEEKDSDRTTNTALHLSCLQRKENLEDFITKN